MTLANGHDRASMSDVEPRRSFRSARSPVWPELDCPSCAPYASLWCPCRAPRCLLRSRQGRSLPGQNSPRTAVGFRSNFAPSDAGTCGAGRNGRGRRVTGGTVGWPFVHVTADEWGRAGRRGRARSRRCGWRWCAAPAAAASPAAHVAARRAGGVAPGVGAAVPAGAAHDGGPSGGRELVEETESLAFPVSDLGEHRMDQMAVGDRVHPQVHPRSRRPDDLALSSVRAGGVGAPQRMLGG
jgi:hypothetical protein